MTDQQEASQFPDETRLMFRKVEPHWGMDELFEQSGWFLLSEALSVFYSDHLVKANTITRQWKQLQKIGRDPEQVMGVKYFGPNAWATMPIFGPWFRKNRSWIDDAASGEMKLQPMRLSMMEQKQNL